VFKHCGGLVREIIVVDNQSTDRTHEVAESEGARVVAFSGTIAAQRNAGAKLAQTKYLAFLDADCTVRGGWSEISIKWLESNDVVAVGAKPEVPVDQSTWVQSTWCFIKKSKTSGFSEVEWLPSCNLWVRTSSFRDIGGFNEAFETCEDVDLGYRINKLGRVISEPSIAVIHYREPATLVQFYRKEVWHGKNSLDGVLKGRVRLHELPSLLAPLIFGVGLIVTAYGSIDFIFAKRSAMFWGAFSATMLAPLLYTLRVHLQKNEWRLFYRVLAIYLVYFLARFIALVRNLCSCCSMR
jgi:glycosyltransferase involved in cell wall biosynthesis